MVLSRLKTVGSIQVVLGAKTFTVPMHCSTQVPEWTGIREVPDVPIKDRGSTLIT